MRETDPSTRKLVDVRRLEVVRAVALNTIDAEVIGKNEHDVGLFPGGGIAGLRLAAEQQTSESRVSGGKTTSGFEKFPAFHNPTLIRKLAQLDGTHNTG
jgi:hypothetical protein